MKVKQWASWMVAASCLLVAACSPQQKTESHAAAEKTYTVGLNAEFAPFEMKGTGGQLEGFDVDLMEAIAKEGGFKVSFKDQPWDGLFASLKNGDFDLLASAVTITDERKQSFDFSEPYFEVAQVILVPEGKEIHSAEDLKNLERVGVVTGNTGDLAAQKILGTMSTKIARFESAPLLFKELESGGVDAAISDSPVVRHYLKNNEGKGFKIVMMPDFPAEYYGYVVRKDEPAVLTALNQALNKVRASGEYDRIYQKYFSK